LSSLPLDPLAIGLGASIFVVSFLMYTGILMTLGAAMPTAKEAGGFFGAVMALTFGPLYAAPLFISAPHSLIVQILSYFPLTAPIPLLLRNAVGNLELVPALISLALLIATTALTVKIGVRIFRFGALEYSRKLSIKEVLRRKS
jgi:ABC-2 type transport system permease protein